MAVRHAPVVKLSDCFSGLVDRQKKLVGEFTDNRDYREAWQATMASNSHAVSLANWSKLSQNRHGLKNHVRAGVSPAVRKQLWLIVSEVSDDDSVLFAKAFGEPADGELGLYLIIVVIRGSSSLCSLQMRLTSSQFRSRQCTTGHLS